MANFSINKVILGGRLTGFPELKQTPNGVNVCTFSIAVNRRGANGETDFFNCTAWRGTGEFINKHFGKGASICVVGTIQNRSWNDNNGQKRTVTDIVVEEALFVDSKAEAPQGGAYVPETYTNPQPSMVEVNEDDNLPF